jgi:hypothetical protein
MLYRTTAAHDDFRFQLTDAHSTVSLRAWAPGTQHTHTHTHTARAAAP